MNAVILAGGLGTRLKPFTDVIPKPLLPIGPQSLLEVQLETLAAAGIEHVYLATNYKSDYVEAFVASMASSLPRVTISREIEPLGTAGPISLLTELGDSDLLVMNGDILTNEPIADPLSFHARIGADLTICTKAVTTPFRFGNVYADEGGRVQKIEEKPNLVFDVLAGIYVISASVVRDIPQRYYGMDDLIQECLAREARVMQYKIKKYWIDIGQVEDYEEVRGGVDWK